MWYALQRCTFDIFCFHQIWWTFKSNRQYHMTTGVECTHAAMVLPVWNDTFYIIQACMIGIMANFYLFPYILHDKYENCLLYWTDKTHKISTFLIKLQKLSPFLDFNLLFYIQVLGHFVTETTLMPSNWFSRAKMGPLFRSLLWAILCGIGKRAWPLLMLSNLLPEMWRMRMVIN